MDITPNWMPVESNKDQLMQRRFKNSSAGDVGTIAESLEEPQSAYKNRHNHKTPFNFTDLGNASTERMKEGTHLKTGSGTDGGEMQIVSNFVIKSPVKKQLNRNSQDGQFHSHLQFSSAEKKKSKRDRSSKKSNSFIVRNSIRNSKIKEKSSGDSDENQQHHHSVVEMPSPYPTNHLI